MTEIVTFYNCTKVGVDSWQNICCLVWCKRQPPVAYNHVSCHVEHRWNKCTCHIHKSKQC
jgi:hypothetical protein